MTKTAAPTGREGFSAAGCLLAPLMLLSLLAFVVALVWAVVPGKGPSIDGEEIPIPGTQTVSLDEGRHAIYRPSQFTGGQGTGYRGPAITLEVSGDGVSTREPSLAERGDWPLLGFRDREIQLVLELDRPARVTVTSSTTAADEVSSSDTLRLGDLPSMTTSKALTITGLAALGLAGVLTSQLALRRVAKRVRPPA